jgi:CAAX prenyl protease-like protein
MRINKQILVRVIPFVFYIIIMVLSEFLAEMKMDVRWIYAIRVGGTAIILFVLRRQYIELVPRIKMSLSNLILAVLTGVIVFILWVNLDQQWMTLGKAVGYDPTTSTGSLNYPMIVMRLVGAALVVPLMEELFWRSFLMRWIDRLEFTTISPSNVSIRAIFFSSLLFASEHTLWFAGLMAGLAYAWLYHKTQNLWTSIIAHAVTNGLLGTWVVYTSRWNYW